MLPKVSIITVCLNSSKYLEDAIRSVTRQSYENIEYLVIDGGSTDGTEETLDKYKSRINKIVAEKDEGIFDAMNKGIGFASGELIYFLNSDDKLYRANTVENMVSFFMKNKDADFIYGNIEVFDPVDNFSYIERYPYKITKNLFIIKTIAQPGTFFKASCFKKSGYFNINYRFAADHDWYLKAIFTKGLKGIHVEDTISVFRLGGKSTQARNMSSYFRERDLIQKKYFNILELLCSRFLFGVKKLLGKRNSKFLHRLKICCFGRNVKC